MKWYNENPVAVCNAQLKIELHAAALLAAGNLVEVVYVLPAILPPKAHDIIRAAKAALENALLTAIHDITGDNIANTKSLNLFL